MTSQEEYIYTQIYQGSLKQGGVERKAKDHAVMGVEDFRKSRFNPRGLKRRCGAGDLIEQRIYMAVNGK